MTFNPVLTLWLTIALLTAMTIAFVWMEYRRPFKYKFLRLAAVFLMMLSVAGLCLRPEYKSSADAQNILLTTHYSNKIVDSLLKKDPSVTLLQVNDVDRYKNSKVLASYQELDDPSMKINAVMGDGVPEYALESIPTSFDYYPSKYEGGVSRLYLPRDIQRNNEYHIQGEFMNIRDSVTLFLERAGLRIDSVKLGRGLHHFDLRFTPRASGNLLYHLSSSGDKIIRPIPLYAESARPLKILVLQGYPTFEIQYLKNFLADRDHQLALRYQLSKGIYRYDYANRKSVVLNKINQGVLAEFDLLISDVETLSKLSSLERAAISEAMQQGLGYLALFPGATKNPQREFLPFDFKKVSHDTTQIKIGASTYSLPAVAMRPNLSLSTSTVTKNRTGALSGYTYRGQGRIGFQLLQETYRLLLSGDSINYGRLWSPLIDDISRTSKETSEIMVKNNLPIYIDEPFDVSVISNESRPSLFADSIRVPLIEDEAIDNIWHSKLWAGASGWHQLRTAGDTSEYYVFNNEDWSDLRAASTIASNLIASRNGSSVKTDLVDTPYPPIYFYLLFVISAGYLWIAPKI